LGGRKVISQIENVVMEKTIMFYDFKPNFGLKILGIL
jgi:hypothetical protein